MPAAAASAGGAGNSSTVIVPIPFDDWRTVVPLLHFTQVDVLAPEHVTPRRDDIRLEAVFAALSDPVRLQIVRALAASEEARACGTLGLAVSKSTASHHFRVLREAGVIVQREDGRKRMNQLR